MSVSQYSDEYGWEPAIPLPLYTWRWFGIQKRFVCQCGVEFRIELDYQEHYARRHWPPGATDE